MKESRATIGRTKTQVVLLLFWGLLGALAYPRVNWWMLAHLSLVPLTLLALRGAPRKRVLGMTYLAAALWWAWMLWWVIPVTGPGFVALVGYLALYPVAYMVLLPLVQGASRLPLTLCMPGVWVALEWLRGAYFITGFPWLLQGQSQPTLMIQAADLVGAYGVSFVVCMSNGFVCDLLTRPLVKRGMGGKADVSRAVFRPFVLWLAVVVGSLVYGGARLVELDKNSFAKIRVAVVQSNVAQSNKEFPTDEQEAADFAELLRLTTEAVKEKPDLIVWPETMVPYAIDDESVRFSKGSQDYRDRLETFAAGHGVPMLVGAHARVGVYVTEENRLASRSRYNSAFLVTGRGVGERYDKVHRVPFGEYLPWVEGWPWAKGMLLKLTPYDFDYTLTAGHGFKIFTVEMREGRKLRFTTPICFEDVVTYVSRKMVRQGGVKQVDLLVNISNDGWFAGTAEGPQHEQIARFRCVENRVPMARAVNTGVSGFIDSAGRVVGRVDVSGMTQRVAGWRSEELLLDDRGTVYSVVGDFLPIGCVAGVGGVLLWAIGRSLARRTRA